MERVDIIAELNASWGGREAHQNEYAIWFMKDNGTIAVSGDYIAEELRKLADWVDKKCLT